MKGIMLVCAFGLLLAPTAHATKVDISGTLIDIPAPAGYVAVTPKMKNLRRYLKQAAPSTNEGLAAFIPRQAVSKADNGKVPVARYFSVQVPKCCMDSKITDAWFSNFKAHMKKQHDETVREIAKKHLPGMMQQSAADASSTYGVDVALSHAKMVPLPVFYETRASIGYSVIVKADASVAHHASVPVEKIVTVVTAHVKDKAIILYCFAGRGDVGWCQRATRKWAAAVVAAND